MKKNKYVAPEIKVVGIEPLQIMTVSGWTPNSDETNNGFSVQEEEEEEENGEYEF